MALAALDEISDVDANEDGGSCRGFSCGESPARSTADEAAEKANAEERARVQREYSRRFWLETFDLGVPWVEDAVVQVAAAPICAGHSGWGWTEPAVERASPLAALSSASALRPVIPQTTSPERMHARDVASGESASAAAGAPRSRAPCEQHRTSCSGPACSAEATAELRKGSAQPRPAMADTTSASKTPAGGQRSHASVALGGGAEETLGVSYLQSPAGTGMHHRLLSPVSSGRGRSKIDLFSSFAYAQAARESAWGPATITDFSAERRPPVVPASCLRGPQDGCGSQCSPSMRRNALLPCDVHACDVNTPLRHDGMCLRHDFVLPVGMM